MRISLEVFGRRRTFVSVAGSLAAHLLLVAALVWVRPPSTDVSVKRGEPLFVELPEADERAERGLPGSPTPAPAPKPVPPVAKPAPAPRRAPASPAPPVVAKAVVAPKEVAPPPAPPEAAAPAPPPQPATVAPTPAAPATETPREAAPATAPKVAAVPSPPWEPIPDIRSLRPGGPGTGGAGGRGEGWAGIEGEPIPLDSKDTRYSDYLDRVRRMIKSKWIYPCVRDAATSECEYKSAKLVIVFGILKDGRVPRVDVAEPSNYEIYDDVAVTAIKLAQPFPPIPAELMAATPPGSAGIRIIASFHYILESSLTNILR